MSGWGVLLPEAVLTAGLGAVLVADLFLPKARKSWLSLLALLATAATLAALWAQAPGQTFGQVFTGDGLGVYLKVIVLLALGLVIFCSWDFEAVWARPQGEYLFLLMSATLGMMFLASGTELVLLYVGLELATFPLVLLTAYRPADAKSAEGGLKYLMLAALGSAILLFGFSLIYAVTGVTQAGQLAALLAQQGSSPLLMLGMLLAIAGVGFKIALVPFHLWAPDAYEGAPTPVTAFLSVASKTAGFALALRLLAGALPALRPQWAQTLAILSAVTMSLGNFAAFPQTNLKRLLAYSSVAQAGYMVMGLAAYETLGLSSLLYYLAAYLFTNLGAFVVVIAVERATSSSDIAACTGLAQRSPRLALALLLALLSLAGIPPLAGFAAKFYLFAAAYGQGYGWLVVLGVLNSALSLYYYLRVVRVMYILPPEAGAPAIPRLPWALTVALLLCMAGILLLGVYPGPFVGLARAALVP
jgi:NADH-quinone oxidoreductase subunit N